MAPTRLGSRSLTHHPRTGVGRGWPVWSRSRSERRLPLSRTGSLCPRSPYLPPTKHDNPRLVARTGAVVLAVGIIHESPIAVAQAALGKYPRRRETKRRIRASASSRRFALAHLLLATMVHRFFDFFEVARDFLEGPGLILQGLHLVLVALVLGVPASL